MTNESYKPITCALHDEYEIAIMHGQLLSISWLDDVGVQHSDTVMPKDILVQNKAEFLVAVSSSQQVLSIRLDRIQKLS